MSRYGPFVLDKILALLLSAILFFSTPSLCHQPIHGYFYVTLPALLLFAFPTHCVLLLNGTVNHSAPPSTTPRITSHPTLNQPIFFFPVSKIFTTSLNSFHGFYSNPQSTSSRCLLFLSFGFPHFCQNSISRYSLLKITLRVLKSRLSKFTLQPESFHLLRFSIPFISRYGPSSSIKFLHFFYPQFFFLSPSLCRQPIHGYFYVTLPALLLFSFSTHYVSSSTAPLTTQLHHATD
jgi:hypothetical protein